MNPKVFISYGSEDRDFVLSLADKLRKKGIDPWVDKLKILPGDSLVDKIFEEGIKNAEAILIVLSQSSVQKKWVREELNASVVKRIEKGTRLIPIIIEDVEVPESLKSTVYVRINNLRNYSDEMDSIINSIYLDKKKYEIGESPKYVLSQLKGIEGLNPIDNIILKISGEMAINSGYSVIESNEIYKKLNEFDISGQAFMDSIEFLKEKDFIDASLTLGGEFPIHSYVITVYGFESFAKNFINSYDEIFRKVCYYLINNSDGTYNHSIVKDLNQPIMLINHVLHLLERNGLIKTTEMSGNAIYIYNISSSLKREFQI